MSMNNANNNLTAGFIDLATYDELEKYMYGGPDATAYFVRETRKSTWFTQCPVTLAKSNGVPEFGSEWSCSISRAGDYLLGTWLHVVTPAVSLKAGNGVCLAWAPNFMHALIKECAITFNDLVAACFTGTHLDFWAAFTTPASKSAGYAQMIGAACPSLGSSLPSMRLNLPLPFFFSRDSGVALPTAALPYNEMRITFKFAPINEMLMGFCNPAPKVPVPTLRSALPALSLGNLGDAANNFFTANAGDPFVLNVKDNGSNAMTLPAALAVGDIFASSTNSNVFLKVTGKPDGTLGSNLQLQLLDSNGVDVVNNTGAAITGTSTHSVNISGSATSAASLVTVSSNAASLQGGINIAASGNSKFCLPAAAGGSSAANASNALLSGNVADVSGYNKLVGLAGRVPYSELQLSKEPSLGSNAVQVWANYAIVSNEERKRMACAPRDILIEQMQYIPTHVVNQSYGLQVASGNATAASNNPLQVSADIRFSHAVKVLFFGLKNMSNPAVHSNYTTGIPVMKQAANAGLCVANCGLADRTASSGVSVSNAVDCNQAGSKFGMMTQANCLELGCCNAKDPVARASLVYENTARLGLMSNDYYSHVQPYYHAPAIPHASHQNSSTWCQSGVHMYSYSLDFICLDPLGSTNYGKLTNVQINVETDPNLGMCGANGAVLDDTNSGLYNLTHASMVETLVLTNNGRATLSGNVGANSVSGKVEVPYSLHLTAVNNNIIRISGGALGFPVL